MAKVKESLATYQKYLKEKLQEKNAVTDVLQKIEEKTGVQRIYVVYGVLAITALWLMVGYGAQLLCNFIGFLYPGYASFKAVESKNKDDDTQWLIYWVVYGTFALAEMVTDVLFFWIPFYWFFKCLFLVWCMVPQEWNGSNFVYYKLIRPFVLRYEDEIEDSLSKAKKLGQDLYTEGSKAASDATEAATSAAVKAAVNKAD